MGWRKQVTTELPTKGIICLAPHTSNWDFIIGLLYSRAEGIWSNFLMKREWFFWPLGPLFRHLGGGLHTRGRGISFPADQPWRYAAGGYVKARASTHPHNSGKDPAATERGRVALPSVLP